MAIISSSAMIRSLSLFHITLSALLLKNPAIIANQGVVLLLGQSMQLVRIHTTAFFIYAHALDSPRLASLTNPRLR